MKSAISIPLVLTATLLLAASAACGQEPSSTVEQVKVLHEQGRQAALNADTTFFQKYLADDYVGVLGDGSLVTKDQNIQMLKSGAIKYEVIDERDVKLRIYENAAIVDVLVSVKMIVNGKPINGDHRATFVWVKQQGGWKEISSQVTRMASRIPRPGNNLGHDARPAPP
jgi:hypothetical protein